MRNGRIESTVSNNNYYSIRLYSSSNNTLENNTSSNNSYYGIYLYYSRNNTLENNTSSNNSYYGIYLHSSSNNTLENNTASNNSYHGIRLYYSSNNALENNMSSNNQCGIYLYSSSNNLIYNNYFSNDYNAYDDGTNTWDIDPTSGRNIVGGPYLGGNYWSDYTGVDNDGDGLGDTELPYNSSGGIQNGGDYHPLTIPISDNTPPTSSVDPVEPYWQTKRSFKVTANATDELSGIASVELWYRYSADNLTWGGWKQFDVDLEEPWSWEFTAPEGNGYYEFYSVATDVAGNIEAPPSLGEEALFSDNFDDGDDEGWTVYQGDWQVINGEYIYGADGPTEVDGVTAAGDVNWRGYVFESVFKLIEGEPQVYVLFRLTDYITYERYDGYSFQYMVSENKWALLRWEINAGWPYYSVIAEEPSPSSVIQGEWYKVKVELSGDQIKCYINNELKIDARDSTFPNGRVGLRADWSKIAYDNVKVVGVGEIKADARAGVDRKAPNRRAPKPDPGSTVPQGKIKISVKIIDKLSGVDPSTITMTVNNDEVTPRIKPISYGYSVSYKMIIEAEIAVLVRVKAMDYAGNWLDYIWSFNVGSA